MRFIIFLVIFGLVAARCPYNTKQSFNQLINAIQSQGQWGDNFGQQNCATEGDSEDDSDDQDQGDEYGYQSGGQFYDEEENEEDQSESGDFQFYRQQSQTQTQGRPQYQLLRQLQQPNSQLAAKLFKQAKQENDDKNIAVSPIAVQIALAALQNGAWGNTKSEIKRVQCPQLSQQQCQQANAALLRAVKGTNNVQQTQKNGSGNQKASINCPTTIVTTTQAQGQFVQKVQQRFGCQVKQCSFQRNPQQCRRQINQLIATRTNYKSQNVVPQNAVTTNTKMIAVSAFQIQAAWGRQFRRQQTTTQGRCFALGSQGSKPCQLIQSQGNFNYYENEQIQCVGIPTEQNELTLYLIIPKNKQALNEIEKQYVQNGQQLNQLLKQCQQQQQQIRVQIPRFQAESKLDAKQTLLNQGVQSAFDSDQADFSGIRGQKQQQSGQQLHLNKLITQATFKVTQQGINSQAQGNDEEGNQGQNQGSQGPWDQYGDQGNQVKANGPFAFAVKHNPTNQIVVVGRVVDPTQKTQNQNQRNQYQNQNSQNENENDFDQE